MIIFQILNQFNKLILIKYFLIPENKSAQLFLYKELKKYYLSN
jgi:hypothetical protein